MSRVLEYISDALSCDVVSQQRIGGGDFAESACIVLADERRMFVKTHAQPPPNFFSTEANGLHWLRESGSVNIPEVILVSDEPPVLVLQWVDQGRTSAGDSERELGGQLAALHRQSFDCFGRPDQRTTGSLAVPNVPTSNWADFYRDCRLLPLAQIAATRGSLPAGDIKRIEQLADSLHDFDDADVQPSLLHGDLWAGNRLTDSSGRNWLIDPAAHGGHREFDLAMMRLFGGYGDACFDAYHDAYPLSAGWQSRISLHQMAPLIVHAIKFGGGYAASVADALNRLL